ncbi:MAG: sigma-54-dependent Fis family transcriptional regulator [Candidatus Koribacter versatilis]|uniref:Sigma-54-dependent Fis family transcriptional regulator n=1 Tax=Candidatus Korobacter versatilis TaxID=658062 RepID=A0A932A6J9_9BACT|nr:sigma-54-dependent Fis family transcriptional regulator [Candidatus Koribacter versatilis]
MDSILLVEDKLELREMLTTALTRMKYAVTAAADLAAALVHLQRQRFSLVLTDLKLPAGSGMDVLNAAHAADSDTPVIVMTAFGTVPQAVEAMKHGAYDFIQKPIDLDHLEHLVGRAIERQQLLRENILLKEEHARRIGFPRIIGESAAMQAAARELQRIAPTDSTVLLLGESGTGKELFARALHQLSPRAQRPLVALNCAAIPETLIENELFGHERGAFTGADSRRAGKFELANGGTIFLDEIGELPEAVQAKLLRALEEKVVERLGGSGPLKVDVRIIAATNRDLEHDAGFRRDLYFRLAVFPIRIPPLRERGGDVALLADAFLERLRRELRKPKLELAKSARTALTRYAWPGNVRELQNMMERAAILHEDEISAQELALPQAKAAAAAPEVDERAQLESVLRECKWNRTVAAERLGISTKTLLTRLRAHGLD